MHKKVLIILFDLKMGAAFILLLSILLILYVNSNMTCNTEASITLALHGDLNNLSLCSTSDSRNSRHNGCCQFVVESVCAEERETEVCMCSREFMCFRFIRFMS